MSFLSFNDERDGIGAKLIFSCIDRVTAIESSNCCTFVKKFCILAASSKRQSIIEKEYVGTQPYICALTEIKYSLPRVPTKTEPIIAIIPTSIEILVKILRRGEIRRSLRIIFNTLKPPSVHFKNCITSLCNIEIMSYY